MDIIEEEVSHKRYGVCPYCGSRVYLGGPGYTPYMGVVQCNCGQWYNIFGQALKPPEDWEEY